MKVKITKILTNNLGLKVVGLVLACLLWLVLSNMQDAVQKRTLVVPIQYDEGYLVENGYVASSKPTSVAVQVWVRKSNISKLESDDFIAKVDTSEFLGSKLKLAPEKTKFNLEISKKTAATYIEDWDYPKIQGRYVEFEVDKIKSEIYPIGTNLIGTAPDGVSIDQKQIRIIPHRIMVTGPTNSFGNLNSVKAVVNLADLVIEDGSATVQGKLQMYDGNDKAISNAKLTLTQETVTVVLNVAASKTASVNIAGYMGEPAIGYGCRGYDYQPKSVTITGSETALAQVTTISIPKTEIDITGATGNMTFEVDMEKYLPADISIDEQASKNVTVTVLIEKLAEQSFLVSTENLQMIGCEDDYIYEILSPSVEITLRAFEEELTAEKVSNAHLQGSINLKGVVPDGSIQKIPVLFAMDSQYSLVGDVYVEVSVREKEEMSVIGSSEEIMDEFLTEESSLFSTENESALSSEYFESESDSEMSEANEVTEG